MLKPVTKVSMYQNIVGQVMSCIKAGLWCPGDTIPPEVELAKTFDVSRNSIREALKSLSYSGMLSSRAGQGTYLTETRTILETELARLAAMRATAEDKDELRELQQKLEAQLSRQKKADDCSNPTEIGVACHMCIAKIAKNKVLMKLIQSIQGELNEQRGQIRNRSVEELEISVQEHKELCGAVLANDPERAAEVMRLHIQHSYARMSRR